MCAITTATNYYIKSIYKSAKEIKQTKKIYSGLPDQLTFDTRSLPKSFPLQVFLSFAKNFGSHFDSVTKPWNTHSIDTLIKNAYICCAGKDKNVGKVISFPLNILKYRKRSFSRKRKHTNRWYTFSVYCRHGWWMRKTRAPSTNKHLKAYRK